MLGKLIKYDIKSMNRFLILIHAFLLLASLLMRFFLTGRFLVEGIDFNDTQNQFTMALFFILYTLLITGVYMATALIIVIHFYKNLFSDQGYLTHTLPVTSGQHLLAKTISGTIWTYIDILLVYLSIYIVAATPYVLQIFHENAAEIRTELGFTGAYAGYSFKTVIAMLLLFSLLGAISNIIMVYASVVIGQLVPGHKILGAIAAYFVINTISSVLSLLFLAVTGLLGASINAGDSFNSLEYFMQSLKLSGILCSITAIILYLITYWIMKKKINLE